MQQQRLSTAIFVVQLLSRVRLCDPMDCSTTGFPVLPISWSFLKLMSIESVRLSNHLILCCPLLLSSIINNKNLKIEKIIKKKKIATQFCKRVPGTKNIRCRSLPCTQAGLVFYRTPEPQSGALKEHPGRKAKGLCRAQRTAL